MPDYNLGPDDLCRTAITALTRQLITLYFILYSMLDLPQVWDMMRQFLPIFTLIHNASLCRIAIWAEMIYAGLQSGP